MKSDSGQELPPIKPVPDVTAAEAIAIVDSWTLPDNELFGVHKIARALRAEVARLEAQVRIAKSDARRWQVKARRAAP